MLFHPFFPFKSAVDSGCFSPSISHTPRLLSQDWLVGYKGGQLLDSLGFGHINVASGTWVEKPSALCRDICLFFPLSTLPCWPPWPCEIHLVQLYWEFSIIKTSLKLVSVHLIIWALSFINRRQCSYWNDCTVFLQAMMFKHCTKFPKITCLGHRQYVTAIASRRIMGKMFSKSGRVI